MNKLVIQGIALVVMLAALPLASIGTTAGLLWASIAGLVAITLGGLIPPVLRFVGKSEDSQDD